MKKQKHKRLTLNRDVVRALTGREMRAVAGGFPLPWPEPDRETDSCGTCSYSNCYTACIDECPM